MKNSGASSVPSDKLGGARKPLIFLVVGATSTIVSFAAFLALARVLDDRLAYYIGYAIGMVISVLGNIRFTFSQAISIKRGLSFAVNYVAIALIVGQIVHALDGKQPNWITGMVATIVGTGLSYVSLTILDRVLGRDASGK